MHMLKTYADFQAKTNLPDSISELIFRARL